MPTPSPCGRARARLFRGSSVSRSLRALVAALLTSLVILSPSTALYAQKASKLKGADATPSKQGSTQQPGKIKGEKDTQTSAKGQESAVSSDSRDGRKPVEARLRKAHEFYGDLRDLPRTRPLKRERPEREEPEPQPRELPRTSPALPQAPAVFEPSAPSAPAPTPAASFDGLDFANWGAGHPPDTNGDVGPTYFIQSVNSSIGIFDKSNGNRVAAFTFNTFMSQGNFGNLCDTSNFGDPVVLYDTFEDRWIITDFAFQLSGGNVVNPPGAFQCIAASKTGDPVSGGWNFYSINTAGGLGDYPKFGIWPDALYMTASIFGYPSGAPFQNARAYAFNKQQMYAGAPTVQVVSFDIGGGDFTVLPSNARLQTGTPPAGTPNYYVGTWLFTNAVTVYKFHVDWDRISKSTFTGPDSPISATSWPNAAVGNAPSQGGNALDVLQIRAMMQNQYTNLGGVESLWDTHTVRRGNTAGFAAPRWYQLDVTGGTVNPNMAQAATWDPDGANVIYRFMPSLAVDRAGDMALGYSTSSSTTKPAIKYAGRLSTDPVNTFSQTEQLLIQGAGTQTGNCGGSPCIRWGDYSAMSLDPDGCTFWYTNEYYAADGLNDLTRIGSFSFPQCTAVGAGGTLSGTVTATNGGAPIAGATVQLGARTATTDNSGVYSFSIPAGTYPSVSASKPGFLAASASTIAVTDGNTTTRNFSLADAPSNACPTDTTQSDFQLGVATASLDLSTSPGDVTLSNAPTIDQQNTAGTTTGTGFGTPNWTGQTFIPAVTGTLVKADVQLFCNGCGATPPNLTLSVRSTSSGLPTGADLATATIPGSAFASGATTLFTASFGSPATLTSGTQYALILHPVSAPAGSGYFWIRSSPSTYANGSRVLSADSGSTWSADSTRDFNFKTYMQTGYTSSGNLVSGVKDANPSYGFAPAWSTLSWNATTPANTSVKFQVAGSNDVNGPFNFVGPDGTSSTFFTTSGASLSQFNGLRYLKYKALLATTDSNVTPTLSDVSLCFTNAMDNLSARDAQAAEPPSAQSTMLFTVSLSNPAFVPVSVNYATADQPAGAGHAVGGTSCDGTSDYLSANSTINFAAGEQIKTVPVTVCSDSVSSEPDETFLLNLSGQSGAAVARAQATGTIRQVNAAGSLFVSEFRESGPGGAGDDFIELYNNSDSPLTVADGTGVNDNAHGYGVFKSGSTCADAPALVAVVPNGTVIPAGGHYLIVGPQYSLGSSAPGDLALAAGVENDRNLAVFSTADLTQLSTVARLDAAGFSANTGGLCDLLAEGNGLASTKSGGVGSTSEYTFFRKLVSGPPQDTNDNASDFMLVSTTPAVAVGSTSSPALGAPGPENLGSAVSRGANLKSILFDPAAAVAAGYNRERDTTANVCNGGTAPSNCTTGTLTIRRTFVNNTGGMVARLRFRVIDITTAPWPGGGTADVRLLSSPPVTVNGKNVAQMDVEAPTQPGGGGYNTTVVATLPGGGVAPGNSVNVQFVLGVQQTGSFRFFVIIEPLSSALDKVVLAKQVLTGGCENTTGNVYLAGPAPGGGLTVSLSTTNLAGVTVPASVFIPAGQTVSPAFNVTTSPVASNQSGTVNATLNASIVRSGLTVNIEPGGSCPP
jgi:hypothetical protein